ncbi:MAG TPA: hypothetical protein VEA69_25385 [Tepidisphaeraceae bacterium]|nr:hypothetical protein [Tepidisphaeraceae bacterium]
MTRLARPLLFALALLGGVPGCDRPQTRTDATPPAPAATSADRATPAPAPGAGTGAPLSAPDAGDGVLVIRTDPPSDLPDRLEMAIARVAGPGQSDYGSPTVAYPMTRGEARISLRPGPHRLMGWRLIGRNGEQVLVGGFGIRPASSFAEIAAGQTTTITLKLKRPAN